MLTPNDNPPSGKLALVAEYHNAPWVTDRVTDRVSVVDVPKADPAKLTALSTPGVIGTPPGRDTAGEALVAKLLRVMLPLVLGLVPVMLPGSPRVSVAVSGSPSPE